MDNNLIDMAIEREEYLSPQEYLRRRSEGKIDPSKVRYATHDPKTGALGGFWIKLDTPRYSSRLLSEGMA